MAFPENVVKMCRLKISPERHQVLLARDSFGGWEAISNLPAAGAGKGVISASWLPNGEVEVVYGDIETQRNGFIRHYSSLNEYKNVGTI